MEVDGKEFLRNVGLEQDKERLIQEQKKLEALKRESVMKERTYNAPNEESAYVNLSTKDKTPYKEEEKSIDDLMLEPEDPAKNKKRYILLGIGLILIFIITILVIRVVSNNDTKEKMENLNPQTKELASDKILDKIDTNEKYQKIIDKKEAMAKMQKEEQTTKNPLNEIVIPIQKPQDTPLVIDKPKKIEKPQRDLFGLTKEEVAQKENTVKQKSVAVKETVKKIVAVPKVVKVPNYLKPKVTSKVSHTTKTTHLLGYYIQVGAFTKAPSKKLLSDISKKGYNYKVHTMIIKGTLYNKVLIGSYPTRARALKNLNKIKKDFHNKYAYILKL